MKYCKQCGFRLSTYGSNYYCCNNQEAFCSRCRFNACKKCNQQRFRIVQPPKCMVCRCTIYDNNGFKEANCGKQFCAKCLSKTFNEAFNSNLVSGKDYEFDSQSSVKLPCGHASAFKDLAQYFKAHCVQCGKDYRETLDLDLKGGLKLCYLCDQYFHDKYLNAFIKCNLCGCCIQKESKAGISNKQDLTLCKSCYYCSQMEEKYIQQNKQLNESRNKSMPFYSGQQANHSKPIIVNQHKNRQQVKVNAYFSQQKKESIIEQKRFQQSFSERKTGQIFNHKSAQKNVKESKIEEFQIRRNNEEVNQEKKLSKIHESQVSPLRKIIQKTWIPEAKKYNGRIEEKNPTNQSKQHEKESQMNQPKQPKGKLEKTEQKKQANIKPQSLSNELQHELAKAQHKYKARRQPSLQISKHKAGSSEYLVTNNFINEGQEVDENLKVQLGLAGPLVMKKFLSDQTLVENLVLELPIVAANTFVKCKQCCIKLPIKLAYKVGGKQQSKQKSSSFLCISSVQDSLLLAKTADSTYNCRVCYHKNIQAQKNNKKSIFEQSVSTNDRSFGTKTFRRSVLQDSRMSNYSRRKDVNPSPLPHTYGLAGAKMSEHRQIIQNLDNSRNLSIRKPETPVKQFEQRIKLGTRQFTNQRPSTPIKPTHEKISLGSRQFQPERRPSNKYLTQKCGRCGQEHKEIIHSLDGGKYCHECYAKKNSMPYSNYSYLGNIY